MEHLHEYKYWAIQISAYIFFTLFSYFCMKCASVYYNQNFSAVRNRKSEYSLYLLLMLLFYLVLVVFSSFRYVRLSIDEFKYMSGRYYFIGGNDTVAYRRIFNIAKGKSYLQAKAAIEKEYLFAFIVWVFSNMGATFDMCLAFFNTLMFFAILRFCKDFNLSKGAVLNIIALLALYLGSFNTLRWSMTLLFSIYFARAYINKNLKKCLLVMIVTAGFQFSAIIYMLPIVGLVLLKKSKKLALFYFALCSLICYSPAFFDISPLLILVGRINQAIVTGNTPSTWLLMYFIYICNIIYIRKTFLKNSKNQQLFYLILFLIPPTFLEMTFGLAYRFSGFGHPLLYMHLVCMRKENKKHGVVGVAFTAVELLMLVLIILKFYFGATIESSGVPYIFNKNLFIQ